MAGFEPPGDNVSNAALFRELTADNFTFLAEDTAKRVATYHNGIPTTILGPPTAGARVLAEFWRDALGGEWRCTGTGTPGTWLQFRPAAVTGCSRGALSGYPNGIGGRCDAPSCGAAAER